MGTYTSIKQPPHLPAELKLSHALPREGWTARFHAQKDSLELKKDDNYLPTSEARVRWLE